MLPRTLKAYAASAQHKLTWIILQLRDLVDTWQEQLAGTPVICSYYNFDYYDY